MTLIIQKETAKKYYDNHELFREQLIKEFGEDFFKQVDFRDIRSFDDACTVLDIDPGKIINETNTPDEIAYKKLKVIISAVNQGWTPDWSNSDQRKWRPWFVLSSGFDFSFSFCGCSGAYTAVGSRLCFESKEKSDYVATQFVDLYKQFLT